MAYVKQNWENLPSTNTPITAERLNHMEDGIAEAWEHGGGSGAGETLRIGTILPYTGSGAELPTGYMLCDGAELSRTDYSDLFAVIGTSFGAGNGSSTFNLPNLKGKVLTGLDSDDEDFTSIGATGGEKTHTLTINEMPSHSHGMSNGNNIWTQASGYGNISTSSTTGANRANISTIASQGGGEAHNILQPYVVVNYIIKVTQSAPVQAQIVGTYTESAIDGYSCNYVNDKLKNDYSSSTITLTIGSEWTATSDGIVSYGGYGASIMKLTINGTTIGQCYGGNQANASLYNSWKVYEGDIVKIDILNGTNAEGNVHSFQAIN